MTKKTEGLRVGPITLVTLIAALLLAVLAVLCATTANAQATMGESPGDVAHRGVRD